MALPYSYLFVPGDDAYKIGKAMASDAGAVILDLEDSVAPSRKDDALKISRDFLLTKSAHMPNKPETWVRLNTADEQAALDELAALPLTTITGIFYPKLSSHQQLVQIGHWLDALEKRDGVAQDKVKIIGIITETANAMSGEQVGTLSRGHPRLRGYTWGVEDLSADLGRAPLMVSEEADRLITETAQMHCLYTAAAAGTEAIHTISTAIHDLDALAETCNTARSLGYTAKMAIHPGQIETINQRLAPDRETVKWAQRVLALMDDHPN